MSIARAETLKCELTDKYVVVAKNVPELKRFVGLTGVVKTVNMNGRALVQFDGPVDISWYDIDPAYLTVVDEPLPKKKAEPAAEKPAPKAAPAAKPAGKSPLELARAQGAAKAGESGDKPLSPLELARQQGAANSGAAAAAPEKKLSPLELARQQGAVKQDAPAAEAAPAAESEAPAPAVAEPEPTPEPAAETPAPAAPSGAAPTPATTAEIIELARQQGPVKS